ncbi:thioesterase II family protein [Ruminiclostridium cellulolyticum]|uniref:Thioesterase n=1 Tax=Ruminiclostridium cellulolyticum (strain ATCC 35319 / DSM 5812 / JCM 6584 / H10) TaxID=394503 RepID=B8I7C8_RUMCH|nr:thioesterase domain-containing protein [Ruminiclostridium cellulolyticum]ACL75052.1 Thioesterase [Ruminiclostridium cellulolyticum H10]
MKNTINLFCFPYAGGSSSVFSKLKRYADKNIKVVPVELAGRGQRIGEPFYKNMNEAINDIYDKISSFTYEQPFAFFGHSMGSSMVFELSHKILQNQKKEPIHLFISGRCPPINHKDDKKIHGLPDNKFIEEVYELGGTPKEVFENMELRRVFLPILRADYKLVEEYQYFEKANKLSCDISVFNGKDDRMTNLDGMKGWGDYTSGKTNIFEFDGGHFFLHNQMKEIMDIMNKTLHR